MAAKADSRNKRIIILSDNNKKETKDNTFSTFVAQLNAQHESTYLPFGILNEEDENGQLILPLIIMKEV